jgi:hypothetical protein
MSLSTIDRNVMRQAVCFPGGSVGHQREDCALSDKVSCGVVLIQLCEHWSERLARVQLLSGCRILRIHVNHEMCVFGKESDLIFRVAANRAVRVSLHQLPNGETVRRFVRRDGDALAYRYSRMARGSRNASSPYVPNSRPTPEFLNPPNVVTSL